MISLSETLKKVNVVKQVGDTSISISGVTDDSRQVKSGSVFVCMPARYESRNARWVFNTDGHDYIKDAVSRGAAAVVHQDPLKPEDMAGHATFIQVKDTRKALASIAAAFFGNPSQKLRVIGVTGTNGKTSTCFMSKSVLAAGGLSTAIMGTITQREGGHDVPSGMTTPEAHRVQKMFGDALEEGLDGVIMEVSSHALELGRVDEVEFDVALFTNLTRDHLDFHQTMDHYLASKIRLFDELLNNSKHTFAIINVDDPVSERIIQSTRAEVITFGVRNPADVKIVEFESTINGLQFLVSLPGSRRLNVRMKILGEYNLYNALGAIGIGLSQGLDPHTIAEGLEAFHTVPGRFERVDCGQDFAVVVDYAHTPDALERVLSAAREIAQNRLIAVFGCGGDRDRTKRPLMGKIATDLADYTIITSDNPRSEDPEAIIDEIRGGIDAEWREGQRYEVIVDRRSAIHKAVDTASKGDMVVIAGKGHETYQILGNRRIHFDDREVALEAIRSAQKCTSDS